MINKTHLRIDLLFYSFSNFTCTKNSLKTTIIKEFRQKTIATKISKIISYRRDQMRVLPARILTFSLLAISKNCPQSSTYDRTMVSQSFFLIK